MIFDDRLEFMDNAAVTASGTATTLEGDVIDITTSRDWGMGEQLYCIIQVTTSFTSGGSAICTFKIQSDAAAAIAVDGSATEHASTAATAVASLTAGTRFILPIGVGKTFERFVGLTLGTSGAALTAGKIDAFLTKDPVGWTAYADATN